MCADGMHLKFASNDVTSIEGALNRDLDSVNNWLVLNKLTLLIGSKQRLNTFSTPPHLTLANVSVDQLLYT